MQFNFFLIIFSWLHWVFAVVCRLSLVALTGGPSLLWRTGFSLWGLLVAVASLVAERLDSRVHGFSTCSVWAE